MKMPMGTLWLVLVGVIVAGVLAGREWLDARGLSLGAYGAIGALCAWTLDQIGKEIAAYQATSKLDAKIANEKIRLLVTSLNALAIAAVVVGALTPFISTGAFPLSEAGLFIWLVLGIFTHLKARSFLNFLKDEDGFAASVPTQA